MAYKKKGNSKKAFPEGMFGYDIPKDVKFKSYPNQSYFMGSYDDTMARTDRVANENVRKLNGNKSDVSY